METVAFDDVERKIQAYQKKTDTFSRRLQLAIKRIFDIGASTIGLILISPLLFVLALLVKIDSPGPIIFKQKRLGYLGRMFTIYKFRTMIEGAPMHLNPDGSTRVIESDPRVTRLGHFLRWTGLDELPQLINVLRGEMSLVGPRADPYFYIENYRDNDFHKLAMRPGVTAWAHVLGRQQISWRERFALEQEYIENYSLLFDIRVLWMTFLVIGKRVGVYNNSESPSFEGKEMNRQNL
jgi:lipopolysaccharide/colanic/teichoic acid biosynthesis glycosyltransferase